MVSNQEREFLSGRRVAYLATADARAVPHVVPVCFALSGETLYVTIDEKPKRTTGMPLKRLRNIAENPAVAMVVDRYDEDWSRLAWVELRGQVSIEPVGPALEALAERYPQYRAEPPPGPLLRLAVSDAVVWSAGER